jgi:hypothetical protein
MAPLTLVVRKQMRYLAFDRHELQESERFMMSANWINSISSTDVQIGKESVKGLLLSMIHYIDRN